MGFDEAWLDANVILRYLLNDNPEQSSRARKLIKIVEKSDQKLKVSPHIICEVIYILEGKGYEKTEIHDALRDFMRINNIQTQDEQVIITALIDYRDKNIDFSDALLAAMARSRGEKVWTFNKKHFAKINVSWEEP